NKDFLFFFQAEDGIRDRNVTGAQTCALPILAIALKAAADGANVAIAAKTDRPHPKLPGTIHTAAEEVEAAGGRALPLKVDIRDRSEERRVGKEWRRRWKRGRCKKAGVET